VKQHKNQIVSNLKRVLKSPTTLNIITVVIITIVVKGFGFYKEVVVAGSFGLSELLDTFYIAALVPGFIYEVFINAFNTVFIPNYIAEQKDQNKTAALQGTSLMVTILASVFFMFLAYIFTDLYLETFFSGHTQNYYRLVKIQFLILLPCIPFWGLTSLISGLLTIYDEFKYSTIYPILTSITIIISLLFFKEILQEKVLAIGMLAGAILQFLFLLSIALKRKIIKIGKPNIRSRNTIIMLKQTPAKISASLFNGINPFVDQYFSAQLAIGSITALNYGNKIPSFSIGVISIALGNVLLPYFSKLTSDDFSASILKLKSIIKLLLIYSIIIVVLLFIFSYPIIEILFERKEFTSNDTFIVSKVQQMYLFQIPSFITGIVMVRFLIAINRNYFMVLLSIISLIFNILLNYVLIKIMGVYGLALATSIVSILNSIILYIYIKRVKNEFV